MDREQIAISSGNTAHYRIVVGQALKAALEQLELKPDGGPSIDLGSQRSPSSSASK